MNVVNNIIGKQRINCPRCGHYLKYIKTADFPYYKCSKCKWEDDDPNFNLGFK